MRTEDLEKNFRETDVAYRLFEWVVGDDHLAGEWDGSGARSFIYVHPFSGSNREYRVTVEELPT